MNDLKIISKGFSEEKLGHLMKFMFSFNIFEIANLTKLQKVLLSLLESQSELKEF